MIGLDNGFLYQTILQTNAGWKLISNFRTIYDETAITIEENGVQVTSTYLPPQLVKDVSDVHMICKDFKRDW